MKKKIKTYSKLFDTEITLIVSDKVTPQPSNLALRKLAEANEHLSKIKNLDEILKRYSSPE
jgi:hypothetical protein